MRKVAEGLRLINDRIDWNLLRTFLVIASEQSFHGAASRLHVTQPAVSQALKRLEMQIGQTLVNRSRRQFSLTGAGELLVEIASEMNALVDKAMVTGSAGTELISGKVHLLTISRIESQAYDDFLTQFHADHPRITIEIDVLRSSDILSALSQRSATAGITLMRSPHPKLSSQFFTVHHYGFFCGPGHPFYGREGLTVDDLRDQNSVSFTSDVAGGNLAPLTAFRERHAFTGKMVGSSTNLDEVVRLVRCGVGIGALPAHIAQSHGLWPLLPDEDLLDAEIYFVHHRERAMDRAEATFINAMTAFLQGGDMMKGN